MHAQNGQHDPWLRVIGNAVEDRNSCERNRAGGRPTKPTPQCTRIGRVVRVRCIAFYTHHTLLLDHLGGIWVAHWQPDESVLPCNTTPGGIYIYLVYIYFEVYIIRVWPSTWCRRARPVLTYCNIFDSVPGTIVDEGGLAAAG